MKKLICECCGGQVDPNTLACPFCGTIYVTGKSITGVKNDDISVCIDPKAFVGIGHIATPNEIRELIGMNRRIFQ